MSSGRLLALSGVAISRLAKLSFLQFPSHSFCTAYTSHRESLPSSNKAAGLHDWLGAGKTGEKGGRGVGEPNLPSKAGRLETPGVLI